VSEHRQPRPGALMDRKRGRPPVADPIDSTLAIRIPESLRARLAARAARDGQSVSELVRAAIDAHVTD
jgi:predicted HicB family RNase H-like nuclease